jgi:hypothetical protein
MCKAGGASIAIPEVATEIETAMSYPTIGIRQIVVTSDITFVIRSNRTLWAWGENVQGGVGNGSQTNWYTYTAGGLPSPFANDLGAFGQLMVTSPVQISNATDWDAIYGSSVFTYYAVARHLNGTIAAWGRNKGMWLNQLATSDLNAQYPNSLGFLSPKDMDIFNLSSVYLVTSPWCIANPGATFCTEFTHGPYHALSPNAGTDKSITTNTTTLAGVVGDTTLNVTWKVISGTATIADSANKSITLTSIGMGSNTLRFTAVNNGFVAFTDDVIVTVSPANTISIPRGVRIVAQ